MSRDKLTLALSLISRNGAERVPPVHVYATLSHALSILSSVFLPSPLFPFCSCGTTEQSVSAFSKEKSGIHEEEGEGVAGAVARMRGGGMTNNIRKVLRLNQSPISPSGALTLTNQSESKNQSISKPRTVHKYE